MDAQTITILAMIFGFYMAWNIGANDVANAFGTSVGSGALTFAKAVLVAAIFEFAGAFLAGSQVTDTIKKGIVSPTLFAGDPDLFARGMLAALLAGALWLNLATWLGQPVSTTHSIIGAIIGFGIAEKGLSAIAWGKMGAVAASWFVSPVAGGLLGFLLYLSIRKFVLRSDTPARRAHIAVPLAFAMVMVVVVPAVLPTVGRWVAPHWKTASTPWLVPGCTAVLAALGALGTWRFVRGLEIAGAREQEHAQVERWFAKMQIMTACYMAFAHGANDVANAIGPIAGIISVVKGTFAAKTVVPLWLLAFGGVGIVVGLATYGYKVIEAVGKKITEMTPSRGFAAEMGTATTVMLCSMMGLPISTTFVLVGAVMGVGFARGFGAIDLRVIRRIFMSWLITIPVCAGLSAFFYWLMRVIWP
jgi:PiT family inorganic phosphate transporter